MAAERLPQLNTIYSGATLEPPIVAPESVSRTNWSPEEALVEIVRGRLEGLGPVTVEQLIESSGLSKLEIETALLRLEAEGFVIRGKFTPGITETEWSARRLLARIHSYTLNRLRQEIETRFQHRLQTLPARLQNFARTHRGIPRASTITNN